MNHPLYVAFVWHMHQPYYKASRSGEFQLPWVRLHALKDYADMVDILGDYPAIRQTFNLVPSLLEQLEEYATGDFRETHWEHTLKPAAELEGSERAFVVDLMCERSWHPRAQRFPRYLELARKREDCLHLGLERCAAEFSIEELRDLQIWFNLAWFDPVYLRREPLAELVARGRNFTEEDKLVLQAEQANILRRTIPAYAEAAERGAVELTTSPYFHPILPLLMNTDIARVSRPDVVLPPRRFAHPEDALEQLDLGLAKHEAVFGRAPRGVWCSEMSIGEDVIEPLADRGIRWTIGDEEHLARSLGRHFTRSESGLLHESRMLYRPYRLEREGRSLEAVFRDHSISDLIGFTYQSWGPKDAAANLVWRLHEIRRALRDSPEPHLVTIALDGENAWEYYPDDGRDFLHHLYQALSDDDSFSCVTVSQFLEDHPAERELSWLHTGSWIYGDFSTWIGGPAHGPAWDQLHTARDAVAAKRQHGADRFEEAWHHILVAEGSDWFWWFSEHQQSDIDHLWDLNFRQQLQEAYRLAGEMPPLELFAPILTGAGPAQHKQASAAFTPQVDGRVSPPEEWEPAGAYRAAAGGTMQRAAGSLLEELRYGAGPDGLHLLLRPGQEFGREVEVALYLGTAFAEVDAVAPEDAPLASYKAREWDREMLHAGLGFEVLRELKITPRDAGSVEVTLARAESGVRTDERLAEQAAWDQVVETSISWGSLQLPSTVRRLRLIVGLVVEGKLRELWPPVGSLTIDLDALGLVGPDSSG